MQSNIVNLLSQFSFQRLFDGFGIASIYKPTNNKMSSLSANAVQQEPGAAPCGDLMSPGMVENLLHDVIEPKQSWFHRWFPYLKWSPSSPSQLQEAEERLLNYVKTRSKGFYVEVNIDDTNKCNIWTRKFEQTKPDSDHEDASKPKKLPLVMIHGMGAGLAFFVMNFDKLAESRTVYAIDLPGFARSSRPNFKTSEPKEVERQYVRAIEEWREKVGLGQMCLLGHSFGGYLSSAYALKYPNRIGHLILADPWGFPEQPKEVTSRAPWWIKFLYHAIFKHLNPLAGLRFTGPMGPKMIGRLRPDLISKFREVFESEEEMRAVIPSYLFHCNAHNPTGEAAFHSLMKGFAWAKEPMLPRLAELHKEIPMTALYGEDSWISAVPQEDFEEIRQTDKSKSYTKSRMIPDAGHHVYANAEVFNKEVLNACEHTQPSNS